MNTQIAKGMHSVPTEPASSAAHHTSMGYQGKEEQEKKSMETRDDPNKKKDVIITVYVESPSPPLPPPPPPIHVHQKGIGDHNNKNKSKPFAKTGGYDRRAQLLAYAKELRNADTKQPQRPKTSHPKPQHKNTSEKSLSTPVRIQGITRNRKRYQRLVPEVDISCRPRSFTGNKKKKKSNRQSDSPFVGRLRRILRGFCRE